MSTVHIHMTFVMVYCYNCYILLVTVFNLLLCLTYKLNLIIGMYIGKLRFGTIHGFMHPVGVLEHVPMVKGVGGYYGTHSSCVANLGICPR